MTSKVYDILKIVCMKVLPFCITVLLGLAQIWNLSILIPISETVALINGALGVALGISSNKYHKSILEDKDFEPVNIEEK